MYLNDQDIQLRLWNRLIYSTYESFCIFLGKILYHYDGMLLAMELL